MPKEFTLRSKIAEEKADFHKKGGRDEYWSETLAWVIQDYHSSKGSVLDFTEDDWLACRDNGLTLYEVCVLCNECRFCEDVDNLEAYIQAVRNDDSEAGVDNEFLELSRQDAIALVEDFYTWREKLPKVKEIFGNG